MKKAGFSLVELLSATGIIAVLAALVVSASLMAYRKSSLAISANNLRQLAMGATSYLSENNYIFWKLPFTRSWRRTRGEMVVWLRAPRELFSSRRAADL